MSDKKEVLIRKASGEQQPFSIQKLKSSLEKAGAKPAIINEITDDILAWIYSGVSTRKIYNKAYTLLRRKNKIDALHYGLKQALMELGPTGYPFEHLVGEIFKRQGYHVETGKTIEGACITHEMDVIATNDTNQLLIECKYSTDQGRYVRVQIPLYVHARVEDISQKRKEMNEYEHLNFKAGLVTNTRFSADAISYGGCKGMKMIAWDFPQGEGLKDIMERENIFPITILSQLTKKQKAFLLDRGIVVCKHLLENLEALVPLKLTERKYKALLKELEEIK
ncbi:MAG: restriction endonuclease [Cyclobacteriaceae bacterium]|nr:restriction endonuclease [Cyclobacteriaceae bacterium]